MSLQQGMERKKVIQHIRGLYKMDLSASRHWQELVQQLTHDRWASSILEPPSTINNAQLLHTLASRASYAAAVVPLEL